MKLALTQKNILCIFKIFPKRCFAVAIPFLGLPPEKIPITYISVSSNLIIGNHESTKFKLTVVLQTYELTFSNI